MTTTGGGLTGKERDSETGLDYFGLRYMSAAQGRFTSPDVPFADQFSDKPQSWNLYAYVRNNLLKFVDDDGRKLKITIFNNSKFSQATAERAGRYMARKYEQAGVQNVTVEIRSGAPGASDVAAAYARGIKAFVTGKQHDVTVDLRSSRLPANSVGVAIPEKKDGQKYRGHRRR